MPSKHRCTNASIKASTNTRTNTRTRPRRSSVRKHLSIQKRSALRAECLYNRIAALMEHTTRYAFKGASRLAADAGVSKSFISRLLRGQSSPFFIHVVRLTHALEKALGQSLDPREFLSLDGTYPTASVCQLAGCRGCLPAEAFDGEGNLQPQFKDIKPGQWSINQLPAMRNRVQKTSRNRTSWERNTQKITGQRMRPQEMRAQETR